MFFTIPFLEGINRLCWFRCGSHLCQCALSFLNWCVRIKLLVMEKTHKGHLPNLMDQVAHTSTKVTWANLARCMNRPKGRVMMLSKVCCSSIQPLRMSSWNIKEMFHCFLIACSSWAFDSLQVVIDLMIHWVTKTLLLHLNSTQDHHGGGR